MDVRSFKKICEFMEKEGLPGRNIEAGHRGFLVYDEGVLFLLNKRDNLDYGKIFGSQNP
jgi:hypothetical protein